ncbi:PH domain-containing protein [Nonlabens antarcticus]|uniref:PH domain-containing protein n=1 Tax=Nonlabens antarcticus TaxID=392714 RepID=UPI001891B9DA|nr:PH domain-containing protein [Nonlabens antarcticus]
MLDLSTPTRQSKKSILLYVFKNVKGLLLFFLYAIFGIGDLTDIRIMLGLTVAFLFIGVIAPFLKYYFFTFHVEGEELIIQQGVLNKERKAIPLERIQSVNINQNLMQRILHLVSVEVETAGSKAKELEIPGLDLEFAESFKNLLHDQAASVENSIEDSTEFAASQVAMDEDNGRVNTHEPLLSLGISDLLKIAMTQNHLRSGFLALGIVVGFWYKIQDLVERFYGDVFENFKWEDILSYASLSLVIVAILIFVFVSLIVSLVRTINKYYGFELRKSGNYLEVQMGLLNKKEVKIPINKIQILEFHTNPLRRLLNYHTAKIFQAQSDGSKSTSVDIPACSPAMMKELQYIIYDHSLQESHSSLNSIPLSHARLNAYILSVPLLAAGAAFFYFEIYILAVVSLLILVWTTFNAYKDGQNTSIKTDKELLLLQHGWLFHCIIITPVFKMQAIEKWRSIFLVRRQQIHFKLHTAAGSRGLRYFKESEITALKNQINNQVILSERSWM